VPQPVVTCDLFSALLDSRSGATAALSALDREWPVPPGEVYDRWDAANKGLQRDCATWVPFAELSRQALAATYAELGVAGSADDDVRALLGSVGQWPLWPDVEQALTELRQVARVGVLSNVDDDLYAATRAAPLLDPALAMTSQHLQAYKPSPLLYRAARTELGPFVHVASSARDVRGSLEAGISAVRLVRPGHRLDPDGPAPDHVVASLAELPDLLGRIALR
jgi:2-haloalkanoic acid dehalogenase type II